MVLEPLIQLRSLNQEELKSLLVSLEAAPYRARQIQDWLHKKHVRDISEMGNLPADFRRQLAGKSCASALTPFEVWGSQSDRSLKYLTKTQEGHVLESVSIRQSGRSTVCVSTQIGCRIRCSFCASGKGKFGRNLSAGEIVEQVSMIARSQGEPVTNVVFMGMGEPLDNYEATMRALEILTAEWGFGLGGRRITVSTSGLTPQIKQFVQDSRGRVRLSVSLHSSKNDMRNRLVPINKRHPLDELIRLLERVHKQLRYEVTFEYTLIRGTNDSPDEARGVSRLANRIGAKVNLIPYNPIREAAYESPPAGDVERFRRDLERKNVRVTVRRTVGRDIDAACGQLRATSPDPSR